jgi:asparagine synthase (glutamine-hydrolysing)
MCGICGELRFDSQAPAMESIHRMMGKMEYRGPDSAGDYQDGPLALGHRRLAIIDLSVRANQPMVDKALDLAIVFNGTIYNYPQLREQLVDKGYSFVSSGDTEVILKAYAEWGEDCVKQLHGMFAFAIWDRKQQRLFLARDRLGIKPLYYSQHNNDTATHFRFASNSQALLAAGTAYYSAGYPQAGPRPYHDGKRRRRYGYQTLLGTAVATAR